METVKTRQRSSGMSTETALSTFALKMCLVKKIGPKREKKNYSVA